MRTTASFDFDGAGVLIVGAASGIGAAAAQAFARAGARIVVCDLPVHDAAEMVGRLKAAGAAEARFEPVDVTLENQVADAVGKGVEWLGRLDVAFNNAGIEGPFGPLHELATDDFDRIIATNLRGVFLGMKYQLGHMRRQGGGTIINTSSTAGVQSIPNVGAYSASKHGIIGLTRAAALEQAAAGIRVNAIAPGPVNTRLLERMVSGQIPLDAIASMVPLQRISEPQEIARAILWLASDAASFVTGEVLMIDGGLTIA